MFGKELIYIGIILITIGIIFTLTQNSGLPKLPGDIYIKKDNFSFYFPITTSIILSIILSLIIHFFFKK